MTAGAALRITSRDNPLLQRLRKLNEGGSSYRKVGKVWIEGEHLCAALRGRDLAVEHAVVSEQAWADEALHDLAQWADKVAIVPDSLFASISALPSPAAIGFLIEAPAPPTIDPIAASLVLDRVQDAGNVGSMLRSAAAFGVRQILAVTGTAALWSPKVLRAGMGAHFGLRLVEGLDEAALAILRVPLLATSSHADLALPDASLPDPCAWVLGHEGQGVSAGLLQACALQVRIPQPGGEESLNVAAAAAVCLYESARRRLPGRTGVQ
ncbi:MAG TPA: RNA methyltransferase [Rubrivivax sp.]|nr:RNA methyltransferase [Rubrivivax sp.]